MLRFPFIVLLGIPFEVPLAVPLVVACPVPFAVGSPLAMVPFVLGSQEGHIVNEDWGSYRCSGADRRLWDALTV